MFVTEIRAMLLPAKCVGPETISESEFPASGLGGRSDAVIVGPIFGALGLAAEGPAIAPGKVDDVIGGIGRAATPGAAVMSDARPVQVAVKSECGSSTGSTKCKAQSKGHAQ